MSVANPCSRSQPQTFFITGGCGFIGSNFVRQQIAAGHRVVILDSLTYAGHLENLEGLSDSFELIVDTICNGSRVSELLHAYQINVLVNFAAESHVDRSIHAPSTFIDTNIQGTFTLLHAAHAYWKHLPESQKKNFRYIQISTDEVYGSLGSQGQFQETTPLAPNSPYSASKAAGDHLARAWFQTYGLPVITTHCSNNYGPYQFPEKLIPHMITCALSDKPLPVYGDGGHIRDWIHVEDHCQGISLAIQKGQPGATYCFGGNAEYNNLNLIHTLCHHLDQISPRADGHLYENQITFVTDRLGHDRRYSINDALAQKELGFTRTYDFKTGLKATVEWYLNHRHWCETVLQKKHSHWKVGTPS